MTSFGIRILSTICDEPEVALAAFSGSITDAVMHPRAIKKLVPYLIKALVAGYLLARFVSPAISERFKLTEKEALAISFICGYAGVRILTTGEKFVEKKIESHFEKVTLQNIQRISTDSSKASSNSSTGASGTG